MLTKMKTLLKGKRGQGMTEWIIIVCAIAIVSIPLFNKFGGVAISKLTEMTKIFSEKVITTQEKTPTVQQ